MPLTDENFDAETASGTVVVVFFQPGCRLCDTMRPILFAVARAMPLVQFKALDVVTHKKTPERFGVPGYPAIIVFKDGKVVGNRIGGGTVKGTIEWLRRKLGS
jgi:thioredoxin 1